MLLTVPVKTPSHDIVVHVEERYRLQQQARDWLCTGDDWVNLDGCHRWPCAARDGQVPAIGVHADPITHVGHYSGLQTCQLGKVCAVCAAAAAVANRQERAEAVQIHRANGGTLLLLTLTSTHHHDVLYKLYDRFGAARRALLCGGPWRRVKAAVGCLGMIEAIENTWSYKHGWHLHTHMLLFMGGAMNEEYVGALKAHLQEAWPKALEKQDMACSAQHGVDVCALDWDAGEYLTKLGHPRLYDADAVLTDIDRQRQDSLSVWDLLRLGCIPVDLDANRPTFGEEWPRVASTSTGISLGQARALFVEYAYVTRGKHSLRWSQGLREKLGMVPPPKDEDGGADEQEDVEVPAGPQMLCFGYMSPAQWATIQERELRAALLQVVGQCDYDKLLEFCRDAGLDWVPEWPYMAPLPVSKRSIR